MEVVSSGLFRVGSLVWQPRAGAHIQTIVCKVTFDLAPDRCPLSATPANLVAFDEREGRDPRKSLTAASELVPFKPRPEVLLTGSVYAPQGRAARHLVASLTVGSVEKAIAVHGDRCFSVDGALDEAAPFTRMPLVWERAAGGADTTNPVGMPMGDEARPDAWGRVHVPNLQPIATMISSRSDVFAPVCFGPIAREWPSRRARLHRNAQTWDPLRWIERPLPEDFDGAYFQDAPSDQWLTEISPEEHLRLVRLHPSFVELSTRLTRAVPLAALEVGGATAPIRLRCDTLAIDADRLTVALVYRGQVPLDHPQQAGRIVVQQESAPTPVSSQLPRWAVDMTMMPTHTLVPGLVASIDGDAAPEPAPPKAVLPFGAPSEPAPPKTVLLVRAAPAPPTSEVADEDSSHGVTALPFRPVAVATLSGSALGRSMRLGQQHEPPAAPPEAPAIPEQPLPVPVSERERLPPLAVSETERPPPTAVREEAETPHHTLILGPSSTADLAPPTPFSPASTPFSPPPIPFFPPPTTADLASNPLFPPLPTRDQTPAFVPPPTSAAGAPVPPPLGLLSLHAPSDAGAKVAAQESPAQDSGPQPVSSTSEAGPAPTVEPPLPLADYPLVRVARIDAKIARRAADEAKILDEEELDAALWKKVHEHWTDTLGAESRGGRSVENRAYDDAYVAQMEAERGPIRAAEYSRLIVAVERGALEQTLSELEIPKAAVIRIQRIWLRRILADPRVASEARAAIRAERELA